MKETRVKNFLELHKALMSYKKNSLWLFRGHSRETYKLVPKAGREPYKDYDDRLFFEAWKRRANKFVEQIPNDDWDWLAIAQHHGLATRLLDWTFCPLTATYFAVESYYDEDAIVYAYKSCNYIDTTKCKPFEYKGTTRYKPNGISQRIDRQNGIFTIHNPVTTDLLSVINDDQIIEKIVIDKTYRKELLFELSFYGINRFSLFPGLDGLSSHVNWHVANKAYWDDSDPFKELEID